MTRWLVILANPAGRPEVEAAGTVLQAAGERVLLVEAENADTLRALAEVRSVTSGAPDADALDGLDAGERLFAEAWGLQAGMADKQRPGEGADWDAEGFEAPG